MYLSERQYKRLQQLINVHISNHVTDSGFAHGQHVRYDIDANKTLPDINHA